MSGSNQRSENGVNTQTDFNFGSQYYQELDFFLSSGYSDEEAQALAEQRRNEREQGYEQDTIVNTDPNVNDDQQATTFDRFTPPSDNPSSVYPSIEIDDRFQHQQPQPETRAQSNGNGNGRQPQLRILYQLNPYGYRQPVPQHYESLPRASVTGSIIHNSQASHSQNEGFSTSTWNPMTVQLPSPPQVPSQVQQSRTTSGASRYQPLYVPSSQSAGRTQSFQDALNHIQQARTSRSELQAARQQALRQSQVSRQQTPLQQRRPTMVANSSPSPIQSPTAATNTTTVTTTTSAPSNLAAIHASNLPNNYRGRRGPEARANYPFRCSVCGNSYLYLNSAQKHFKLHHGPVPHILEMWKGAPRRPPPATPRNAKARAARVRAGDGGSGVSGAADGTGAGAGTILVSDVVTSGGSGMAWQQTLPPVTTTADSAGLVPGPPPPTRVNDDSLTWVARFGRWYRRASDGSWEYWDADERVWKSG